ncbi:MAG TPA: hypothetical protein VFL17_08575, partial [Anaerolineae bacterium]|nr:hypothetical protein [Anaerolineae bacterium]
AGLLHQPRHGALPGSERWLYTVLKPGRDPIEQLALAMARMAKSPDAGHYIRRNGASNSDALHESAESLLSDRRDQRAVIVVDQFEETFTQAEKGLSKQRTRREADGQREQLHARYSGEKAIVAIQTLALLRGRLPPRAFGLVIE